MTQWANLWNHTDCLLDQTASFKLMFACSLLRNRQQNWVSVNFTVTVFSSESNFTFEKKNAKVVSPSVTSSPIITFQHHFFAFLTFPHYLLLCSHVAHKKPFRHVLTPSPSTSCAHLPILSALLSAWSASVRIKSEGHFWSWEGTKDAISVHTKLKNPKLLLIQLQQGIDRLLFSANCCQSKKCVHVFRMVEFSRTSQTLKSQQTTKHVTTQK